MHFSLPPPYTKLKLGKNSGYTRPTLFVELGGGVGPVWIGKRPKKCKCPKTFVHDWKYQWVDLAKISEGQGQASLKCKH